MPGKLSLQSVTRTFGPTVAVDGVSLGVAEGEILAVLGPSGCGKTTLLMLIAGLLAPSGGRVIIDGRDVTELPANKRRIGVVFQSYALFPHMTVRQNILFGLENERMPATERSERLRTVLELTRLVELADRYPAQLSGGQQQRVALGRALALKPPVILLDEPFSNLDAKVREKMRVELGQFLRGIRATAILVTHDQEDASYISDRVVVMRAGRAEQTGSYDELYRNPASPFVADFLGHSNWLSGSLVAGEERAATVAVGDARWRVSMPRPAAAGARVAVMVRRNALTRLSSKPDGGAAGNRLTGELQKVVHMGPRLLAWMQCGEQLLPFDLPPGSVPDEGTTVEADLDPALCFAFPDTVER